MKRYEGGMKNGNQRPVTSEGTGSSPVGPARFKKDFKSLQALGGGRLRGLHFWYARGTLSPPGEHFQVWPHRLHAPDVPFRGGEFLMPKNALDHDHGDIRLGQDRGRQMPDGMAPEGFNPGQMTKVLWEVPILCEGPSDESPLRLREHPFIGGRLAMTEKGVIQFVHHRNEFFFHASVHTLPGGQAHLCPAKINIFPCEAEDLAFSGRKI